MSIKIDGTKKVPEINVSTTTEVPVTIGERDAANKSNRDEKDNLTDEDYMILDYDVDELKDVSNFKV